MSQQISVSGMSCAGCEESVEEALAGVSGVTTVEVDRTADSATIEGEAAVDELVAAVEDAGYEAAPTDA